MDEKRNFKEELSEYNRLFDIFRETDYALGKKYSEECRPNREKAEEVSKAAQQDRDRFRRVINDLDQLGDLDANSAYKEFCSFHPQGDHNKSRSTRTFSSTGLTTNERDKLFSNSTFERIDFCGDKEDCLKDLDKGAKIVDSLNANYNCPEYPNFKEAFKQYRSEISSYHRTFYLFRARGLILYVVCGTFALAGLITLLYPDIYSKIIASILIVLFGGALVARMVYDLAIAKKRKAKHLVQETVFLSSLDDYYTGIMKILTIERNESYRKMEKAFDELQEELRTIGDKWQAILRDETKDIVDRMRSYETIDKSVRQLQEYFGEEIHYSNDYMSLFERYGYFKLDTEEQFMDAVRSVIEKKKQEIKEQRAEEQRQREREEERKERTYQLFLQEQNMREQKAALERQQSEGKEMAGRLCASCKQSGRCLIQNSLNSPVCSAYQPRK